MVILSLSTLVVLVRSQRMLVSCHPMIATVEAKAQSEEFNVKNIENKDIC